MMFSETACSRKPSGCDDLDARRMPRSGRRRHAADAAIVIDVTVE
jgi:hypothetical protein